MYKLRVFLPKPNIPYIYFNSFSLSPYHNATLDLRINPIFGLKL